MHTSPRSAPSQWYVFAAALLALSWLLPNHHEPWVDFYSDAWAAIIMWGVAFIIFWKTRKDGPLTYHLLPILVLVCISIAWIQYATSLVDYFGVAFTASLYLVGFCLALLTGAKWEQSRAGEGANFIFLAVLLGATGSLCIQLQQWLQINPGAAFWLFIPAPPRRFHANLGQANQAATLMCLGILACAWLHEKKWIAGWVAWIWAACLAMGLALAESRTSWLIIGVWLILGTVWFRQRKIQKALLLGTASWACLFTVFIALLPQLNLWLGHGVEPQTIRSISTHDLRLEFWSKSWKAIVQHPWSGYGWMQTSYSQFALPPEQMITGGTLRHAHNLALDLLIDLGLPIGITVIVILSTWIVRAAMRTKTTEQVLMFSFVTALIVHALLEFPLHYAYFLLPLGLVMGLLNSALGFKSVFTTRPWSAFALLIFAGLCFSIIALDYAKIEEEFFALRFENQKLAQPNKYLAPDIMVLNQLQDMIWLARVDPSVENSPQDIKRALRSTKLLPSVMAQYKMASMYAFAEKKDEAQYWIEVMFYMNKANQKELNKLYSLWNEQAEKYPPMADIRWPEQQSR